MEVTLRTATTRFVLVHYHIFKNAGSTIEWILRREFADAFATLHSSDADAVLGAKHLHDCLQKNPEIKAVSSHHLRYPMGAIPGTVFFDCCFLRHPLDRLQSLYEHFRRTSSDDWLSHLARRESSQRFLQTLIERTPHMVSNVQTLYMATGGAFTRPAGPWDLKKAVDTLEAMSFPGLVDRFDESLVAAEYFLRPAFPNLRLEYIAQNVARRADSSAGNGRSKWVELWGHELYNQLIRLNEYDLKLFKRAAVEIQRRTTLIPCFPKLLEEFQLRCAALQSSPPARLSLNRTPAAMVT